MSRIKGTRVNAVDHEYNNRNKLYIKYVQVMFTVMRTSSDFDLFSFKQFA